MLAASRNIDSEPLLGEQEPSLPRMGAYAPPGDASSVLRKRMSQRPLGETHGLANDFSGHVHHSSMVQESDEDDLPPLPPLISYCSYVRFGCAFAKWHMLVALLNLGAYSLCRTKGYLTQYTRIPFDSWTGSLSAVWTYLYARRCEQDVQDYDRVAQYEQGQQAEDPEDPTMTSFIPNYEHMHGYVSRKLDAAFTTKGRGTRSVNSVSRPPPEGTSSLVNLSFVLWSIAFAAAFSLAFGIIVGKGYTDLCDSKIPSNSTSLIPKNDYNKLQSYPAGVQDWANVKPNEDYYFGCGRQTNFRDEIFYGFPTASTEAGSFAELTDGTIFLLDFRHQ